MIKAILKIVFTPLLILAVLFTIYFFNLDMKFTSRFIEPFLLKHYDKIPRKQYV